MKADIRKEIEQCPICGRCYTDDDADCGCEEPKVEDWEDVDGSD